MPKFPEFTKITLDPQKVPANYAERSRRCVNCETCWPDHPKFLLTDSPCCRARMLMMNDAPVMTWPEAIRRLKHWNFERFYEKYLEGLSEAEQDWLTDPLDVNEADIESAMEDIEREIKEIKSEDT